MYFSEGFDDTLFTFDVRQSFFVYGKSYSGELFKNLHFIGIFLQITISIKQKKMLLEMGVCSLKKTCRPVASATSAWPGVIYTQNSTSFSV